MRNSELPIIHVEGSAQDRGFQYGQQAASRIVLGCEIYRRLFATRNLSWDRACDIAAEFSKYLASNAAAHLVEIKSIARGAGLDWREIIILNARSELLNMANLKIEELNDGCTSALAMPQRTKNGRLLHGQNWDWRPECADTAIILHITPETGPRILSYVEAGGLARAGLNSAGIAVTGNNLETDKEGFSKLGIPISIIRRRILEADNFGAALEAVYSSKTIVSNNMTISCAQGAAINLETTPAEIFWALPEGGIITHANHFSTATARAKVFDSGVVKGPDSLFRDSRVRDTLTACNDQITLDDFKTAFFDDFGGPRGVLRRPVNHDDSKISATVAMILMDASKQTMWVCNKPYENSEFVSYSL